MKIISLLMAIICSQASAKLYLDINSRHPVDRDLFERILNPEECHRQLRHIRRNDTLLRIRFMDAGMRVPRGMLLGNLQDLGNYEQCLDIHETVEDMSIEGKYCTIRVPINLNLQGDSSYEMFDFNFDPRALRLNSDTNVKLTEYNNRMRNARAEFTGMDPGSPSLGFGLALCVPKVCTTEETIAGLLFNLTAIGFRYEDHFCRIRNDKPWVPADYVAIIIFSILGLLTILSTCYEIHHNVISKKDPKLANEVLISFSVLRNCRRLLVIKPNPNNIQCLDGIRSLATLWVVVGHVFFVTVLFTSNIITVLDWSHSPESFWIMSAKLTVDTFFLLSGLLLVYVMAHKFTGRQLIKNFPVFCLNRLLRMFPLLAAVILFEASFANRLGDGPLWNQLMSISVHRCRNFWWTTLLHLQNFIAPMDACLGVTWYLAIDVQLHILSPIVLFWVFGRSRTSAWTALTTALFASLVAATAYIYANEELLATDVDSYLILYYYNILTRAPPFFVGLVYGYMLHLWRNRKVKMDGVLNVCLTAFFMTLLSLVMYCYVIESRVTFNNRTLSNLFLSFLRPLWALSLGWIIFACEKGYAGLVWWEALAMSDYHPTGKTVLTSNLAFRYDAVKKPTWCMGSIKTAMLLPSPINWFLSLNVWKIPARISYAMYLIHMSLIMIVYSSSLHLVHFSVSSLMFDAFGFLWILMFVSFFMTALIDAPFAILFKKLLEYVFKKKLSGTKMATVYKNEGTQNEVRNENPPM